MVRACTLWPGYVCEDAQMYGKDDGGGGGGYSLVAIVGAGVVGGAPVYRHAQCFRHTLVI